MRPPASAGPGPLPPGRMAIAPGQVSADPAETPDGERVIVPSSIYAPGTLVDAPADADGAATGAPPRTGQPRQDPVRARRRVILLLPPIQA